MASSSLITFLIVLSSASSSLTAPSASPTATIQVCCPNRSLTYSEEWNFFNVRKDANLFYWLYSEQQKSDKRPLFLWLQGGPGLSATGNGNFQEVGPLDVDLKPRNTTWLSRGDLLFLDNPVGSGYSYVTNDNAYTTTVDQVGNDVTDFMIHFLDTHVQYQKRPFYLMGECYASKMSTVIASHFLEAIKEGKLKMNFKGVGLGQTFLSPIDFVHTWADSIYHFSRMSPLGLKQANDLAAICDGFVQKGQWTDAANCALKLEALASQLAGNISLYNVMHQAGEDPWVIGYDTLKNPFDIQLNALMNGPVIRQKLNIPKNVVWSGQRGTVFSKHVGDFMKPVIDKFDALLNTNLTIFMFNGQFDILVNTPGVERWLSKSKWASMQQFQASPRQEIRDKLTGNKEIIAFLQTYKNLYHYSLEKAGHLAPVDAPIPTLQMLDLFTSI